jgi:5-methylcytosine-specific restriction endonuclease McrA
MTISFKKLKLRVKFPLIRKTAHALGLMANCGNKQIALKLKEHFNWNDLPNNVNVIFDRYLNGNYKITGIDPFVPKSRQQNTKSIHPLINTPAYVGFYKTDSWRLLRYEVLKKYGAVCQCCGAKAGNGVVIHVDHIKPRSLYPHLELCFDNLQPLCEDCNLAKSNTDETDWRKQTSS